MAQNVYLAIVNADSRHRVLDDDWSVDLSPDRARALSELDSIGIYGVMSTSDAEAISAFNRHFNCGGVNFGHVGIYRVVQEDFPLVSGDMQDGCVKRIDDRNKPVYGSLRLTDVDSDNHN